MIKVNNAYISSDQIESYRRMKSAQGIDVSRQEAADTVILSKMIQQEVSLPKTTQNDVMVQLKQYWQTEWPIEEYLNQLTLTDVSPKEMEIRKFYDANPVSFGQRRVFVYRQLILPTTNENFEVIKTQLEQVSGIPELMALISEYKLSDQIVPLVNVSSKVPLELFDLLKTLSSGEIGILNSDSSIIVIVMDGNISQPLSYEEAKPTISTLLANENKQNLWEQKKSALLAGAQIFYLPGYDAFVSNTSTGERP